MTVHETVPAPKAAMKRPMLGLSDDEKVDWVSNEDLPLVIIFSMCGHDVARCLVDEGSSVDILYQDAFKKLGLRK